MSESLEWGTEPEAWVTVSAAVTAWAPRTLPLVTLHRAGCRYVKRAKPEHVDAEFDGPRSAEWVYYNATGFDRVCKVCSPDFHR